jgi:hypothetical protein
MSDHLLIATRKGLFALERKRAGWDSRLVGFEGVAVTNVLRADGVIYAALKHGHFGAKLHRSDDDGATWRELTGISRRRRRCAILVSNLDDGNRRAHASGPVVDRRHSGRIVSLG